MDQFHKTWQDIVDYARGPSSDPMTLNPAQALMHQAITLMEMGRINKEEALIELVLGLAEMTRSQHKQIIDLINVMPTKPFIQK